MTHSGLEPATSGLQSKLSYIERPVEWGLNLYCTLLQYCTSLYNHAVDYLHQACIIFCFIKTENIAVDEIWRIIFQHLLARAHTYFHIKLLCMHDAVRCNILAIYSTVKLYIPPDVAKLGTRLDCNPEVAGSSHLCATIFLPTVFACYFIRLYR